MLIRITNGTYGHRPKLPNGEPSPYVIPITRNDPPIDVDEAEAARLVEGGIAVYAQNDGVATPVEASDASIPNGTTPEAADGTESPTDPENEAMPFEDVIFTTDMKADELRAAMRERGLAVKVGMTKQAMVDALNGADEAPVFDAQDVVEE